MCVFLKVKSLNFIWTDWLILYYCIFSVAAPAWQTFAKIAGVKNAYGDPALNKEQFDKFFEIAAKRPDMHEIYER